VQLQARSIRRATPQTQLSDKNSLEGDRAMDTFGRIEALGNNFRYAARRVRRSPGFTAVAILTLALGIGVDMAAFVVVRAVLLNPLPYPHPEQLVKSGCRRRMRNSVSASPLDKQVQMRDTAFGRIHWIAK
jgi:hypothetical protein